MQIAFNLKSMPSAQRALIRFAGTDAKRWSANHLLPRGEGFEFDFQMRNRAMRCQEVLEQLPILAYNELDKESAARCHEHLAGCAACQAEWESIRGALSLLDQAPRRAAQVDLAAICLRIARQQRRSRIVSRWTVGLTAAAAVALGMLATQLLAVNLEPGRLVVAWNAPPEAGPIQPGTVDRVGTPQGMIVGGPGAGPATQPAGDSPREAMSDALVTGRNSAPNMLVLLFEGDRSFAGRRIRNVLSLDDGALGASFDEALGRSREPTTAFNSSNEPKPTTYSDLLRKLIDAQPKGTPRAAPPGA